MSNLGAIMSSLFTDLGLKGDTASPTGSVNAKVAELLNGTTSVLITYPNLTAATAVTSSGSAWTYGNWATVVSSNTLAAHCLVGICVEPDLSAGLQQLSIGQGAGPTEIAQIPIQIITGTLANYGFGYIPIVPALFIPANAAVSARLATAAAAVKTANVYLTFAPRPL